MQAADILENKNYDLIILDVLLPKLNGFELMEYIRPLQRLRKKLDLGDCLKTVFKAGYRLED